MKSPQFYAGNLVSQLCLCMQLRAFGLPVSFSLPPSNNKAPLPKFRSITGERGDHTWADFTGCFYGGKNKQKKPWELRKEKERDGILSCSCSVTQSPWLSSEDGNTRVNKHWKSSLLQSGCILHPHSAVLFMRLSVTISVEIFCLSQVQQPTHGSQQGFSTKWQVGPPLHSKLFSVGLAWFRFNKCRTKLVIPRESALLIK